MPARQRHNPNPSGVTRSFPEISEAYKGRLRSQTVGVSKHRGLAGGSRCPNCGARLEKTERRGRWFGRPHVWAGNKGLRGVHALRLA